MEHSSVLFSQNTALICAASKGHLRVCKLLVASGADIKARSWYGCVSFLPSSTSSKPTTAATIVIIYVAQCLAFQLGSNSPQVRCCSGQKTRRGIPSQVFASSTLQTYLNPPPPHISHPQHRRARNSPAPTIYRQLHSGLQPLTCFRVRIFISHDCVLKICKCTMFSCPLMYSNWATVGGTHAFFDACTAHTCSIEGKI